MTITSIATTAQHILMVASVLLAHIFHPASVVWVPVMIAASAPQVSSALEVE